MSNDTMVINKEDLADKVEIVAHYSKDPNRAIQIVLLGEGFKRDKDFEGLREDVHDILLTRLLTRWSEKGLLKGVGPSTFVEEAREADERRATETKEMLPRSEVHKAVLFSVNPSAMTKSRQEYVDSRVELFQKM